ncbi:hypothetical protein K150096H7_46110 [[Clostridium] symbiosum]
MEGEVGEGFRGTGPGPLRTLIVSSLRGASSLKRVAWRIGHRHQLQQIERN